MSNPSSIAAALRPVLRREIASARRASSEAHELLGRHPVRKASARPFLVHINTAEAHYKAQLVGALRFGFDARRIARQWTARPKRVAKATPKQKNDILAEAQDYVQQLQADPVELVATVEALYGAGYLIGAKEAVGLVRDAGAAVTMSELTAKADAMDWSQWTPGDRAAAAELAGLDGGAGLKGLLDSAGVMIKSIQDTRLDQLAAALADGTQAGDSVDAIAGRISDLLDDPTRAELIANTELNRAVTSSTLDTYRLNSIDQFNVLVFNPCEVCENEESANPHDLDEDAPPFHPGCRCAASPVVSSSSESSTEE